MCAALAGGWLLTKKSMGADTVDLCVLVSFINKEIKSFLFLWDVWTFWVSSLRRLWSVCVSQGHCLATFPTEFSPPLVHLPPHLPPDPCLMTTHPSCPSQKVGWQHYVCSLWLMQCPTAPLSIMKFGRVCVEITLLYLSCDRCYGECSLLWPGSFETQL